MNGEAVDGDGAGEEIVVVVGDDAEVLCGGLSEAKIGNLEMLTRVAYAAPAPSNQLTLASSSKNRNL